MGLPRSPKEIAKIQRSQRDSLHPNGGDKISIISILAVRERVILLLIGNTWKGGRREGKKKKKKKKRKES